MTEAIPQLKSSGVEAQPCWVPELDVSYAFDKVFPLASAIKFGDISIDEQYVELVVFFGNI